MKIPGLCGKRLKRGSMAVLVMIATLMVLMTIAPAWASTGGGEHEGGGEHAAASKPWQVTDTAKVLNFAVLAIGLFLVLRKPVSQALLHLDSTE